MRNEQIKTALNNSYSYNWLESADFRVVIVTVEDVSVDNEYEF